MSRTSPSSDFSKIDGTKGGIIYWDDGHSIYAESIEEAIAAGMKHFVNYTDGDDEHFILCSKESLNNKSADELMAAWLEQMEKEGLNEA